MIHRVASALMYRKDEQGWPLVYVIVLNWNGKRFLQFSLHSIQSMDYPNFKTLVVDGGSRDGSQKFIEENFPKVKLIKLGRNLGWPSGNNVGILYALKQGAQYIALFNNDILVDRSWLKEIVKAGESDKDVGVLGGKVYYLNSDILQVAGGGDFREEGLLDSTWLGYGENELDLGQHDQAKELDFLYEAAICIKAQVIKEVGLLDPLWFAGMEGPDFCTRTRRKGYRSIYVPAAKIRHLVAGTSRNNPFLTGRGKVYLTLQHSKNHLRFNLKHYGLIKAIKAFLRVLTCFVQKSHSRPLYLWYLLLVISYGSIWNIVHITETLRLRRAERESYEYLYSSFNLQLRADLA